MKREDLFERDDEHEEKPVVPNIPRPIQPPAPIRCIKEDGTEVDVDGGRLEYDVKKKIMTITSVGEVSKIEFDITFWQALKLRIAGKHIREYLEGMLEKAVEKPKEIEYTGFWENDLSESAQDAIDSFCEKLDIMDSDTLPIAVFTMNEKVHCDSETIRLQINALRELADWLDKRKLDRQNKRMSGGVVENPVPKPCGNESYTFDEYKLSELYKQHAEAFKMNDYIRLLLLSKKIDSLSMKIKNKKHICDCEWEKKLREIYAD